MKHRKISAVVKATHLKKGRKDRGQKHVGKKSAVKA
jgi:hypothetical protein